VGSAAVDFFATNKHGKQCCGSVKFYPGSGSKHFSIPLPDPNISFRIPDPTHKRVLKNKNFIFVCFLWFQDKVFIVKKIIHPGSGKKFIPIPDPGSRG
jgi:hypothetical protein